MIPWPVNEVSSGWFFSFNLFITHLLMNIYVLRFHICIVHKLSGCYSYHVISSNWIYRHEHSQTIWCFCCLSNFCNPPCDKIWLHLYFSQKYVWIICVFSPRFLSVWVFVHTLGHDISPVILLFRNSRSQNKQEARTKSLGNPKQNCNTWTSFQACRNVPIHISLQAFQLSC